ncbi:MAG: DNA polymerase III subunit gamma/tau [Janthinobacterium lividum]
MSDTLDDDLPPPPEGPGLFGEAAAPAPGPAAPYRVLARKYRPAGFEDLIGQDAAVRILRRAFALGRVAHAFMLTGVRGVGKTTTARIIARCLCCIGPDGTGGPTAEPCGVCPNCTAILADRHPDVIEMDAASRTGVDDVREIIEATRFRPMQARAKVFIVDEVHMLSRNAFNALLKTLEEPPPHVTFVFATTELRKVPVTVLSRCQRFDLRRVSVAELSGHFARIAAKEGVAVAPEALDAVARAADGSVRDGLSLLDQAIARGADEGDGGAITAAVVADMLGLADRGLVFDLLDAVMRGEAAEALAITARAHERGADLGLLLGDLLELTHTLTRLRTVPGLRDSAELAEAERTRGVALAERLSIPELGRAWQMLLKGMGEVEQAPDRRGAAEMVLIRLCHVAELPTPGELVRRLAGEARPAAAQGGGAAPAPAGMRAEASGAGATAAGAGAAAQARPGALVARDRGDAGGAVAEPPPGVGSPPWATEAVPSPAPPVAPAIAVAAQPAPVRAEAAPAVASQAGQAQVSGGTPARPATLPGAGPDIGEIMRAVVAEASASSQAEADDPGRRDPDEAVEPAAAETPPDVPPPPRPLADLRDVAMLVAERLDPMLHAHLLHSVHLVRFAPPVIELRPDAAAPRDLAPRLAALLLEATGTRWTIALSTSAGEPTLAEQGVAADLERRGAAAGHPLVQALLAAFPGARIEAVHDSAVDRYGLPALEGPGPGPDEDPDPGGFEAGGPDGEPDMPDFAPPDALPAEAMPDEPGLRGAMPGR